MSSDADPGIVHYELDRITLRYTNRYTCLVCREPIYVVGQSVIDSPKALMVGSYRCMPRTCASCTSDICDRVADELLAIP